MMVGIDDIVTCVSVLVAIGSLVLALVVSSRNRNKDIREDAEETMRTHANLEIQMAKLDTKMSGRLETIDSGVRDLKADNRNFRSEITQLRDDLRKEVSATHDEALHAMELAEAAHRRLDRIGAEEDDMASMIMKRNKEERK